VSNQTIVARLSALTNDLEAGRIGLLEFSRTFIGHVDALENVGFAHVKQAHAAWAQLENAFAQEKGDWVDVPALVEWFRGWLAAVPLE
jgi:hypothetical protein